MIRYQYNQQVAPPAPFVHITVRRPDLTAEVPDLPGLLDTAADRTVLPQAVVDALGLTQMRARLVLGVGGQTLSLPTFLVELEVRQLRPLLVEVFASPDEPHVLLGRDVLNQFRILLDGPQLALEMS